MEGANFSLKVAILALVALSGQLGTALQFHCDTPDEWLGTRNLIDFDHVSDLKVRLTYVTF